MKPVSGSEKILGRLTTRALSGAATSTSITSMLNRAVSSSSPGGASEQPSSSSALRTELVPEP